MNEQIEEMMVALSRNHAANFSDGNNERELRQTQAVIDELRAKYGEAVYQEALEAYNNKIRGL